MGGDILVLILGFGNKNGDLRIDEGEPENKEKTFYGLIVNSVVS